MIKLRLWKGWAFEDLVVSSQHHSFSSKVAFLKHFQVFLQRICSAYVTMKHKRGLVGSDRAQFKNNVSKNMQTGMSFIYLQKILFEKIQWVSTPIKKHCSILYYLVFFAFCFLNSLASVAFHSTWSGLRKNATSPHLMWNQNIA